MATLVWTTHYLPIYYLLTYLPYLGPPPLSSRSNPPLEDVPFALAQGRIRLCHPSNGETSGLDFTEKLFQFEISWQYNLLHECCTITNGDHAVW